MNFQPPDNDDPRDDDERAQAAEAVIGSTPAWRCFHCDATFSLGERDAAQDHFGRSERSAPACQIDAAEYREMEARMHIYNEEDSELHRQMWGMHGRHLTELIREEEKGYARGLADAKKHPAELGLQPIPECPNFWSPR